ncbi:hypothetical protein BH20ACI3_BH20ACI3_39590 [soil metagenome]
MNTNGDIVGTYIAGGVQQRFAQHERGERISRGIRTRARIEIGRFKFTCDMNMPPGSIGVRQ